MPIAGGLFERYALGTVSAAQLEAETGLAATRIRMILTNPLLQRLDPAWCSGAGNTRSAAPVLVGGQR